MNTPVFPLPVEAIQAFLSRQMDVRLAYLFGSTARGQATSGSDVDIAILLETDLDGILTRHLVDFDMYAQAILNYLA